MNRSSSPRSSSSSPALITGRLEGHGPANYQFGADQNPSYYVKIATQRGIQVLWGKDLARAMAESITQPQLGVLIGARRNGYDTFTLQTSDRQKIVRRTRWIVESVQFFADRAQLARRLRDAQLDARRTVKDHPELISTYLSLRGTQAIAERRIADPRDRARFLTLVREAMATSIKNGDPLPEIRLKAPSKSQQPRPSPPKPPRDNPTR